MKAGDHTKFNELIASVYSVYRADVSPGLLAFWWNAMQPYDLEAVQDALGRHAVNPDTGQFLPKPADVVKMLQGSTQDSALVAWAKIDRAVRTVGTYASVVFDDPLIHVVISEMGGWVKLGATKADELPFRAKEFENRYRGLRARNERPAYPPVLVGIAEAQNSTQGYKSEPPILLGDPARAEAVLRGGSAKPLLQITPMAGDKAIKALKQITAPQEVE